MDDIAKRLKGRILSVTGHVPCAKEVVKSFTLDHNVLARYLIRFVGISGFDGLDDFDMLGQGLRHSTSSSQLKASK